ncbi:hypothetical protein CRG98_024279 [Punica granatum]|uniref:BZIP domain-containing protein n=1 Tax=Punica granatum TaxID=22663 RepID=A0A2I0JGY6_PUNGR|nr:hypothetical protein CRG98_024279 [Punica granatum]
MAEKGKRPIEEEEDILNLIDFDMPEEEEKQDNLSPVEQQQQQQPDHGMKVKLTMKTAIPYRVPVHSEAVENAKAILREMESKDGFFAKFLRMNGIDPQNPQQAGEALCNPTGNANSNRANRALKIKDISGMPLIPGTRVIPPGSKRAAQLENLLKIYAENPERAKRIVVNRLSALRVREKSQMYKNMLKQKINTLKAESYVLSQQLQLAQHADIGLSDEQKNSSALKAESALLKAQMENIQQQIQVQDVLNEEISNEIEFLRLMTGPVPIISTESALLSAQKLWTQIPDSQHHQTEQGQNRETTMTPEVMPDARIPGAAQLDV